MKTGQSRIESTPKRQTGRHCEGEARSNLLISNNKRLLRYARNDDKSLFGMDSRINIQTYVLALFLFINSGLLPLNLFSQKEIEVTARGSYEARDLTLEEVRNKAIDEAKKNAMVKAGISENVQVSDFLYTFEDDEKFKEIFQSFVSTETGAEIIVEEVNELKRNINEFGNILIEVEISAIVYKHEDTKDPSLVIKVDGIKEFYLENDPLDFSFTPSKDGFLKIFNVTDESAFILYPYNDPAYGYLNDDPERIFKKNEKIHFPINQNMDGYYFGIDYEYKSKEYNLLIFVFTKDNIPFLEKTEVNKIMKWIYQIPLNERAVEQYGIVVKRK